MKRYLSIIIVVFILINMFSGALASTVNGNCYVLSKNNPACTESEAAFTNSALEARKLYSDDLTIEPLYDADEKPAFLIGITSLGYIIIQRDSEIVFECGENNPFIGFDNCKKYYGGVLSYYVKLRNQELFYNIVTKQSEALPRPFIFDDDPQRDQVIDDPGIGSPNLVSHPQYITKYAFGYNINGTCNVVAFGIALNYIKRQYGLPVTAYNMTPELFNHISGSFPDSPSQNNSMYPKAETLHSKLNQYFIYSYLVTWGATYCSCANSYLTNTVPQASNRPELTYQYHPSYNMIRDNISASKPVIVSTLNDPVYENHTMVAYGCRNVVQGGSSTKELLIHTGLHESGYFTLTAHQYTHNAIWLNMNTISFGYFFIMP